MAGNIAKRPNGKWRARYRDETGREHSRHFSRKVDAQQWLDRVTAAVVTDSYVDSKAGRITFTQFYEDWSARQVWVPGTVLAMNLATGSATFAELPLKSIRRSQVEAWVKGMNAAGLAPGTIKTRFNNVRSAFKAAHRDRLISTDPTHGVTPPRVRRAEHAMRIPSPAELGRLLAAANPWFRPFVALCGFAGLRLGEAAALKVEDVNFLGRQLTVPGRSSAPTEARSRSGPQSTALNASSSFRTAWSRCFRRTLRRARQDRTDGCSQRRPVTRRTRTPSATGGARPSATRS